jgi:hypothetical protein
MKKKELVTYICTHETAPPGLFCLFCEFKWIIFKFNSLDMIESQKLTTDATNPLLRELLYKKRQATIDLSRKRYISLLN